VENVLIALLALLGVNLMVIVVLLAFVLARKRWVKRQPGSFRGAIRVCGGDIDGLRPKWVRGYGRWVRDVLVWTKAPFLFRNEAVPANGLDLQRPAAADEVKRLGDQPVIAQLAIGSASVEVAARGDERALLLGPYGASVSADHPTPLGQG
jgi:hypothetical protein